MERSMKLETKKLRGTPFSQVKERLLKNPAVKRAYDDHTVILEAAAFIRQLRKNAGLTQEDLAKRMGVSQALIARLEVGDGKRGMTIAMFARVISACGQPVLVQPAPKETVEVGRDHLVFNLA